MMRIIGIFLGALVLTLAPGSAFAVDEGCVSSGCHEELGEAEVVHEAIDNCADCHVAISGRSHKRTAQAKGDTSGDFKLLMNVPTLCWECHDDRAEKTENLHPPYEDAECFECHDVHQAANKGLLKVPVAETCFNCHDDMAAAVQDARFTHDPVESDESCITCHHPHGADPTYYLKQDTGSKLCGGDCHDDIVEAVEEFAKENRHGPLKEGKCQACHNPHGSRYAMLLKGRYPEGFYAPWNVNNYRACFDKCHDAKKFGAKAFSTFGNDGDNLHALHVNRQKGRTCRFCHEPHVSRQEHLLRESVPFGSWAFDMSWMRDDKPGAASCTPACHDKKSYNKAAPRPAAAKGAK